MLDVYAYILEHEKWDSDFWGGDHGPRDIAQIFQYAYNAQDWTDLAADLPNWSSDQLELFTDAIMNGYGYNYLELCKIHHDDVERFRSTTSTIVPRSDLLLPILDIENGIAPNRRWLAPIISENFDFILNHFDVLIDADPKR